MPVRVVLVPDAVDRVDAGPLLLDLGTDVADTARQIAPVDEGDLRASIRVTEATANLVRVTAGGIPGPITGKPVDYAGFVERGTSKMRAQPYLRPALYRYRSA